MYASEIIEVMEKLLNRGIKGNSLNEWYNASAARILETADLKALEIIQKNSQSEFERLEIKPDESKPIFMELIPGLITLIVGFITTVHFIWQSDGWTFLGDFIAKQIAISSSLAKWISKLTPPFVMSSICYGVLNWIWKELLEIPDKAKDIKRDRASQSENSMRRTLYDINGIVTKVIDERTKDLLLKSNSGKRECTITIKEFSAGQKSKIQFELLRTKEFGLDGAIKAVSSKPIVIRLYSSTEIIDRLISELKKAGISVEVN